MAERAAASVDDAVAFVAADSPRAAARLLTRILESAESLSDFTERGRNVPEVDEPQVRELIIPPYRLVYEYNESQVQILTLLDTEDDPTRVAEAWEAEVEHRVSEFRFGRVATVPLSHVFQDVRAQIRK